MAARLPTRIAMVTPYCREPRAVIERCIASVQAQTVACDHIIVADGFPQDWIDAAPVRHLQLDACHRNGGNTPRALGSLLAASEGYDAIGLLDADNWLEPDHVETCLAVARRGGRDCAYVAAARSLRRRDESVIDLPDEPLTGFVDTNCYFLLPRSYSALSVFALMPHELMSICDRVFYLALQCRRLRYAISSRMTVNYTMTYAPIYRHLGEPVPEPVKENPDHRAIMEWIGKLPRRQYLLIGERLGLDLGALYR